MLGYQLMLDFFGCDTFVINDLKKVENIIMIIKDYLDAEVIQVLTHQFSPQGISCVAIISASHIAIHTWPENCFASVDIFTCRSKISMASIVDILKKHLCASKVISNDVSRGAEFTSHFFNGE